MAEPETLVAAVDSAGTLVHVRHWSTEGPTLGSVLVMHGIQSHGGWYVDSCAKLAEAGFDVWLPDRRGSGLNSEHRGDAPSFRRLLDDIATLIEPLPRPRYLLGISWGGKLAVGFQWRHRGLCDGLILVAPGLCQRVGLSFGQRCRVLVSRYRQPTRLFPIPLNDPELFTANPARQRFIIDDPVALRAATARLLLESARLDVYNRLAARFIDIPVLILLAERDRIIDNQRTRKFANRLRSRDLTVREYAGAHHTLEFEPGGPPFLLDLVNWLQRQAAEKKGDFRKNERAIPPA